LSSGVGASTASFTRNFPFPILSTILSMPISLSSNFTLIVDVAEFNLKAVTPSVFFRIELILDRPDQSQHPETFRSYILSAAMDACERAISIMHRNSAVIIFLVIISYRSSTFLSIFNLPVLIIFSLAPSSHARKYSSPFNLRRESFTESFFAVHSFSSSVPSPLSIITI